MPLITVTILMDQLMKDIKAYLAFVEEARKR